MSALLGQKLVVERILRRPTPKDKNGERFLLGGNSAGRAAIATTIQYVYEVGDWMNSGVLPIGTVFPRERVKYVQGYMSYPNCKKKP